jgi:argininosuccinate lyase
MSKLWDKGTPVNKMVEQFTVGNDREMDLFLAKADVLGSLAHISMLKQIGLLKADELKKLSAELTTIYHKIEKNQFKIDDGVEDVHSQIEILLTKKLGEAGKKIHSGRSRNDQVLVDIRLYLRSEIMEMVPLMNELFSSLIKLSEKHKNILIPGYTHMQVAMPSSFGLWFGAYAESLSDDMILLQSAYSVINQNPLGSAAGYGSSFPLNRTMTTKLLGFDDLSYNVVYAQMGRGKSEKTLAFAMSSVAATLAKMAMDVCMFMNQNFAFVTFPDELTTGSSIMPHKKNPDVFELIRAKCNAIQALPNDIAMVITNLSSGYHRDLQILKEMLFPAIQTLKDCLFMADMMLNKIIINKNIINDEKYLFCFSVEEANKLVLKGIPFRDAYKKVGEQIKNGTFKPERKVKHTHEGSIGNLCNDKIHGKMKKNISAFAFDKVNNAIGNLLNSK